MSEWKQYRRTGITEMRPWGSDVDMTKVSVSSVDQQAGSPKPGDMIARNVNDHADQWLVSAKFFADTGFSEVETIERMERVDASLAKQLSIALGTIAELRKQIAAAAEGMVATERTDQ